MPTKNKNLTYFLALCAFFGLMVLVSKKVDALPVISEVGVTVSTSSAQVGWTASDTVTITDSFLRYGYDTNYLLSSTRRALPTNVSGTGYYFAAKLSNLNPGSKIYYKITLKNNANEIATHADSFDVPLPDTTPPTISGITAAAQAESATISWETNEEALCYVEYWRNGEQKQRKEMMGQMKDHYIYIGGLVTKVNYNYQIFCSDSEGNKGESTIRFFSTSGLSSAPKDATRLQAVFSGNSVNITWLNPSDASFDKVKLVRSSNGPAPTPSDGNLVYEGKEQRFTDTNVSSGQTYYYTIFSLNAQGQYSGGTTAIVGNGSAKVPESNVSGADKIFISQIEFYTNKRTRMLDASSGTVTGSAGTDLSIGIPLSALAYPPESIQVLVGANELHQFALGSNQRSYYSDFTFPPTGKHVSNIVINYSNGMKDVVQFTINSTGATVVKPIVEQPKVEVKPEPVKTEAPVSQQVTKAAEAIAIISSDEEVKSKVTAAAPTVVGVTTVGAISVLSWVNIIPFLQLLIQPLSFVGRKKRSSTGLVYNALDKLPIDLATVRLLSRDTGKVVQSKVTDSQGRYAFTVAPGLYKLQVLKNGYTFPTQLLKDFKDDGKKGDIYHGQTIEASVGNNIIAINIPVDPVGDYEIPIIKLWSQKIFKSIQTYLVWIGLIIIIISLYISPRWYTAVLLPIQVLVLVMTQRLQQKPRAKSWGVIIDAATQRPINQAIVRLFNAQLNKLIASQVTDSRGRYFFIAGEDRYYLTVEKAGYQTQKTSVIDLVEKKTQTISVDVALQRPE